jgi:hypothetical protein
MLGMHKISQIENTVVRHQSSPTKPALSNKKNYWKILAPHRGLFGRMLFVKCQ